MAENERHIYTVTELTAEIRATLEDVFTGIWLSGEISNFHRHTSGHMYFTLKDEASQIRAVMFKGQNRLLRFRPEDGMAVVAFGRVTVYERRGEYQISVEHLEPKGVGALQVAFEQLKQRLEAEGLFDPARKRPIPMLPERIGVITSPTGAVIRDILNVLGRRFGDINLVVYPVPVQGAEAAPAIVEALQAMNRLGGFDVLIVARGGGSIEDLWAFNEEAVARAIAASKIPVISAVGHETDFTIADFVADLRAPTPSAAAELVVARKDELVQRVDDLLDRLASAMTGELEGRAERLRGLERTLAVLSPLERIRRQRERAADLARRVEAGIGRSLERLRARLERAAGVLDSLSPLAILGRGYSICYRLPAMTIVKDAAEVAPGDRVRVRLHRGAALCTLTEAEPAAEP
ncbi:MAG TPA: exodeoxyribonuclease VII large subunit [Candidatus Methylomirabilis sp.]